MKNYTNAGQSLDTKTQIFDFRYAFQGVFWQKKQLHLRGGMWVRSYRYFFLVLLVFKRKVNVLRNLTFALLRCIPYLLLPRYVSSWKD